MCFWHDERKPPVTFFFFLPPPEFCWWWWQRQPARVPPSGRDGGDEVTHGAGHRWCPSQLGCSCLWRESGSSQGSRSGKPGHGVDDVGQGGPGLGGREALQGRQSSVSVAAAEVDGRSHTFASLDRFLQLSENTGTTGWVSAVPACPVLSKSTGLPPPLPKVKARTQAVRQSSSILSAAPFWLPTTAKLWVI